MAIKTNNHTVLSIKRSILVMITSHAISTIHITYLFDKRNLIHHKLEMHICYPPCQNFLTT